MDIEVKCDCGNPDCHANVQLRKGYVHIRHPDGRKEVRWDHFYIDAFDWDGRDPGETKMVELMLPPREARRVMWFLVREYMPAVSHAVELWRRYPACWWQNFRDRLWRWRNPVQPTRDNDSDDPD